MAASDDLLIANGVDAITADYLLARAASPLAAPLRVPVEVVIDMIEDPAAVTCDEATGGITGARQYLHSYVDLDGTVRHVVTDILATAVEGMKEHT